MKYKRAVISVSQIVLSAVALLFVFQSIEVTRFYELLKDIDLVLFIVAFAVVVAIRFVIALRWRISLGSLGILVSYSKVLQSIFVSHSFGYLTPGSLGVDVVRAYQISSRDKPLLEISSTLFLERLLGLVSLVAVASIASLWSLQNSMPFAETIAIFSCSALIGGATFGMLLFSPIARNQAVQLRARLPEFGKRLLVRIMDLKGIRAAVIPTFLLSLSVQLLRCGAFYILFIAIGKPTTALAVLMIVPIVLLVMMLPISIGGVGVREGTLLYFSLALGVNSEQAVLVGVSFYSLQILALVPGFAISGWQGIRQLTNSAE